MKIEDVKKSLNKFVRYKGAVGGYKFVACTLRRNENGFYYQAELLDTKHGRAVIICKLEDISGVLE